MLAEVTIGDKKRILRSIFPTKPALVPLRGLRSARWKVEIESRCWLALLYTQPRFPGRVPEYTRIDGRIDGVELLLSNPDPGFPGSLNTHTESQGGRQR